MRGATVAAWLQLLTTSPKYIVKLAIATSVAATCEDAQLAAGAVRLEQDPPPRVAQDTYAAERAALSSLDGIADACVQGFPMDIAVLMGARAIGDLRASCPDTITAADPDLGPLAAAPRIAYCAPSGAYRCLDCDYTAFDMRSMTTHASRKHTVSALTSVLAHPSGVCLVCLKALPPTA